MKAIYLNVQDKRCAKVIEIEDNLETFYELIGCRCIDIVRRRIGGKLFEIICDDEGALVENPTPSAIDPLGNVMLVGNLIIVSGTITEDGDLTGLNEKEIEWIQEFIESIRFQNKPHLILTCCEY